MQAAPEKPPITPPKLDNLPEKVLTAFNLDSPDSDRTEEIRKDLGEDLLNPKALIARVSGRTRTRVSVYEKRGQGWPESSVPKRLHHVEDITRRKIGPSVEEVAEISLSYDDGAPKITRKTISDAQTGEIRSISFANARGVYKTVETRFYAESDFFEITDIETDENTTKRTYDAQNHLVNERSSISERYDTGNIKKHVTQNIEYAVKDGKSVVKNRTDETAETAEFDGQNRYKRRVLDQRWYPASGKDKRERKTDEWDWKVDGGVVNTMTDEHYATAEAEQPDYKKVMIETRDKYLPDDNITRQAHFTSQTFRADDAGKLVPGDKLDYVYLFDYDRVVQADDYLHRKLPTRIELSRNDTRESTDYYVYNEQTNDLTDKIRYDEKSKRFTRYRVTEDEVDEAISVINYDGKTLFKVKESESVSEVLTGCDMPEFFKTLGAGIQITA